MYFSVTLVLSDQRSVKDILVRFSVGRSNILAIRISLCLAWASYTLFDIMENSKIVFYWKYAVAQNLLQCQKQVSKLKASICTCSNMTPYS